MKKTLVSLAAGAALVATAGMANADGYGYGSVKDAPLAAPQANWNGLYIGAAVGYGIATTEVEADEEYFPPANLDGLSSEGLQGTITVGYDRQVHPNWVLGIFADYSLGELETEVVFFPLTLEATIKDSWAIGARVGYVNSCCTMWYVTAGYAQADVDLKALSPILGHPILMSENMDGWFIGGGVEHQISENLFLKLDYRYTNYDKVSWASTEIFDFVIDGPDGEAGYLNSETDVHSIRLGVNWKLGLLK